MRHPRWKAAERWKMAERWIHLRHVAAPVKAAAAARQLTRRLKLPVLYSIDHDESVRTRKRRHVCRQRRSRRGTKCQPQQHLVSASSQVCPYGEQGVGSVVPSRHLLPRKLVAAFRKKNERRTCEEGRKIGTKRHTSLLLARDEQVIREDPAKRDAKLAPGPRVPEMPRETCKTRPAHASWLRHGPAPRTTQTGRSEALAAYAQDAMHIIRVGMWLELRRERLPPILWSLAEHPALCVTIEQWSGPQGW